eukprot:scaffold65487_cov41-Prasinocladus_malaysianus.AAC.1
MKQITAYPRQYAGYNEFARCGDATWMMTGATTATTTATDEYNTKSPPIRRYEAEGPTKDFGF